MVAFRDYVSKCMVDGSIKVIDDKVGCDEIGLRTVEEEKGENRPLLFRNVIDYEADVIANLFGHHERMAQALSANHLPDLFGKMEEAIAHALPLKTRSLIQEDYDIIDKPDIPRLIPQFRYSQDDATPYLTSSITLTKDPASDRYHICFVRLAVIGENRLLFNGATPNIRKIVESTVGQGDELEVNILIGPPVEIILLACMSLRGKDKLRIAQALSGGGLAFSVDSLPFPHQSEYVLKAKVIPKYQKEGPFGDLLGLYSVKEKNPECHVSQAICRKNPIYHSVMAGMSHEHTELVAMGARFILQRIKRKVLGVIDYQVPSFGVGRMALIKVTEGFKVEEVVPDLWSIPIVRLMIFVNEDVDISSPLDIFWAIIQRAKAAEDFQFSEKKHPVFKEKKVMVDATAPDLASWDNRRIKVFGGR